MSAAAWTARALCPLPPCTIWAMSERLEGSEKHSLDSVKGRPDGAASDTVAVPGIDGAVGLCVEFQMYTQTQKIQWHKRTRIIRFLSSPPSCPSTLLIAFALYITSVQPDA